MVSDHAGLHILRLTNCIKPSSPVLLSPSYGSGKCAARQTFTWTGVDGATAYHIQTARNTGFTAPLIDDELTELTYSSEAALAIRSDSPAGAGEEHLRCICLVRPPWKLHIVNCPYGPVPAHDPPRKLKPRPW